LGIACGIAAEGEVDALFSKILENWKKSGKDLQEIAVF
jgi:hypothetical protein